MKSKNKKRLAIVVLSLIGFVLSVAPLIIFVAVRWGVYVTRRSDGVRLSIGLIIVGIAVLLKVLGKLKKVRLLVWYLAGMAVCYLLASVIRDMGLLLLMLAIGQTADTVVAAPLKRLREGVTVDRTADEVEERVRRLIGEKRGD